RHTSFSRDWSSDVCSSDLIGVTRRSVRVEDLSADLQKLYRQMDRMVPDDVPYQVDQAEGDVNNILMDMVKVGESHGLHFPREFEIGRASCRERGEISGWCG